MKQLRNFSASRNKHTPEGNPMFDDAVKKYGGMAEDELIEQLISSVRRQRAEGTYDPVQMNAYVQMLSPHLSEQQCEKLRNIISIINSENV